MYTTRYHHDVTSRGFRGTHHLRYFKCMSWGTRKIQDWDNLPARTTPALISSWQHTELQSSLEHHGGNISCAAFPSLIGARPNQRQGKSGYKCALKSTRTSQYPTLLPRTFIRGTATSSEHPWINYHIAGNFENLPKIRSYKAFTTFNFASKGHNLWSTLHMRTYVYYWENSGCTSTWKWKVRGYLCIAMKGSLWRSVPPVRRVRSTSCCNYYGPFDCVRDDVLCAATCWLTLRDCEIYKCLRVGIRSQI